MVLHHSIFFFVDILFCMGISGGKKHWAQQTKKKSSIITTNLLIINNGIKFYHTNGASPFNIFWGHFILLGNFGERNQHWTQQTHTKKDISFLSQHSSRVVRRFGLVSLYSSRGVPFIPKESTCQLIKRILVALNCITNQKQHQSETGNDATVSFLFLFMISINKLIAERTLILFLLSLDGCNTRHFTLCCLADGKFIIKYLSLYFSQYKGMV